MSLSDILSFAMGCNITKNKTKSFHTVYICTIIELEPVKFYGWNLDTIIKKSKLKLWPCYFSQSTPVDGDLFWLFLDFFLFLQCFYITSPSHTLCLNFSHRHQLSFLILLGFSFIEIRKFNKVSNKKFENAYIF